MLSLRKPEADTLREFLDGQANLDFSYERVGATAFEPPERYIVDHTRAKLGCGDQIFMSARSALQRWQQFRLGWLEAWPTDTPIRKGETVAVVARSVGVWWLNACRIVYVIDQKEPVRRFGFAYGTLPDHVGTGEERFFIEMDESGDVWYDILAFSRPRHLLARLAYPFVRAIQKRFGRESVAAMFLAVHNSVGHNSEGKVR